MKEYHVISTEDILRWSAGWSCVESSNNEVCLVDKTGGNKVCIRIHIDHKDLERYVALCSMENSHGKEVRWKFCGEVPHLLTVDSIEHDSHPVCPKKTVETLVSALSSALGSAIETGKHESAVACPKTGFLKHVLHNMFNFKKASEVVR